MAEKSTVYFDGDKKRIYEVPPDSALTVDGEGFRIYTPNDILSAPTITLINIQEEIWSRGQDWWADNSWCEFPLLRSGGALRGTDELGNDVYQSVDFTLKANLGWRIVLANYKHQCQFKGNLYSDDLVDGFLFDDERLTEFAYPRITGASDLITYRETVGSGLDASERQQLFEIPTSNQTLEVDERNRLFEIPTSNETLTTVEHDKLLSIVPDSRMTNDQNDKLMSIPTLSEISDEIPTPAQLTAEVPTLAEIVNGVWSEGNAMEKLTLLFNMEGGKWEMRPPNTMIFFEADNITEVARFNLFDADGNGSVEDVFRRDRIS